MDKDLDARFEKLERALGSMIDSLAKNNPSRTVAEELVAAEAELAEGLKLLERHQNNAARIQQLRQETSLLDTQIKDIASSLWTMRKELKAVPVTTHPPAHPEYRFTTAELLAYARRISRNTLPLPGVTNGVEIPTPQPPSQQQASFSQPADADDSFRQTQTPNTSFNLSFAAPAADASAVFPGSGALAPAPTALTQDTAATLPPSQAPLQEKLSAAAATAPATKAAAESKLPTHLRPAVNPLRDATFLPWPSEARIRSGALAAVQALVDAGINPKGYDPAEEERKRKRAEEEERERLRREAEEREERERRMREERERMARERERARMQSQQEAGLVPGLERRESLLAAGGGGQKPKQFTFLGADDDDDDDDAD
ncbi:hypothetical protein VTJ83DRAFT_4665 [Remersonia thermophila]|uniref:Mediator of RNA polymerase II transcription subunit 4 n=1 Tax=Remersonia thermophila TaxID=72144 RepID=A0ABR4DAN5_9PEZI